LGRCEGSNRSTIVAIGYNVSQLTEVAAKIKLHIINQRLFQPFLLGAVIG